MRQGRNFPALAALNGKIFAMGGRAPDSIVDRLSSVEVYDVETNQWRVGKPLVTQLGREIVRLGQFHPNVRERLPPDFRFSKLMPQVVTLF